MWWLVVPPLVYVFKVLTDDEPVRKNGNHLPPDVERISTLVFNFERLRNNLIAIQNKKRIAIIGQPGSGKSSMLITISNNKITPIPAIGISTDATNWADDPNVNLLSKFKDLIFADVPGYNTTKHPFSTYLKYFPFYEFHVLVFVFSGKFHAADEKILKKIYSSNQSAIYIRSFSENLNDDARMNVKLDLENIIGAQLKGNLVFFSNRTGEGKNQVLEKLNDLIS